MLMRLLTFTLHTWAASALSLPPNTRLLPNVSSSNSLLAVPINASSITAQNGDCFSDPRLLPASYFDCFNAASSLLDGIKHPLRPKIFARKGRAWYRLPKTVRNGTCVISLDVANDDDRDQFQPWVAYTAALGLANECVGGSHCLGGKRTVGPRSVVDLIVFGREWPAGNGDGEDGRVMVLEMSNITAVDGGETDGNASRTWNTTSLELTRRSLVGASSLNDRGVCFEMPKAHEIRFTADRRDCYQAADNMIEGKARDISLTFSRNSNATFHLPATFDYGTCSIVVDVLDATDDDTFELWRLHGAVLDVANRCTMTPRQVIDIWGGIRTAGLKGSVNVIISGIALPDMVSVPTTSGNAHVVTRTQAQSKEPKINDDSSVSSDVPILEAPGGARKPALNTSAIISNGSSASIVTSLGGALTCYDPPLPRELLYPYVSSDCDKASQQIIGHRNKWTAYIFSRRPSTSPYWYQLPVKYTYGSCVILIDMNNDKDEDSVRVNYVESSAWVLAHKCSGEEDPEYKYGGFMTAVAPVDRAEPDIGAIAECVFDR